MGPLRVLLVEDNPADAELQVRHLQREGFEVDWQRVDTEAAYLTCLGERLDLILSDFEMPHFSGLRALEILRQRGIEVPFIIVSGTIGEETAVRAMKEGATDFVIKDRLGRLGPSVAHALESTRLKGDLRRGMETLAAERTLLRTLIDHIPDLIYAKDAQSRYLLANAATATFLGVARPEDVIGRTDREFFPPEVAAEMRAAEERVLAGHATINREAKAPTMQGQDRRVLLTRLPLRNAEGSIIGMAGIARDITEQRQLEERYRHAQKMEAVGTLAGGIAHDFNNILSSINGYAELARMDGTDPVVAEYLDAVLQGGRRATDLVRQILSFSRQQEPQRLPVELRQVVREALKLLRATIPASIEFVVELAADAPPVLADISQIHQVIMNLGSNAAHAMRDRPGCLTVRLQPCAVDAAAAHTKPGLRPGPYALLTVSDTGHGMDAATLARIFEPFFTTKAIGEGTGLGLAAVHGIMQNHDGLATVVSEPGVGTTFSLYFPAHLSDGAVEASAPASVPRGAGERILYVDDEASIVRIGQKVLTWLGYEVDPFTRPIEALEALRSRPTDYDLIVTDQMMPGMIGTDLAQRMLSIRPDLPIILTTGFSATLTGERVQAMGLRRLLMKPLSIEVLGAAVHEVLHGGGPSTP